MVNVVTNSLSEINVSLWKTQLNSNNYCLLLCQHDSIFKWKGTDWIFDNKLLSESFIRESFHFLYQRLSVWAIFDVYFTMLVKLYLIKLRLLLRANSPDQDKGLKKIFKKCDTCLLNAHLLLQASLCCLLWLAEQNCSLRTDVRLDFFFPTKSMEEWMTGPIPQDTNGCSLHWDVKIWDQELAFSHSASSVTAASFPLFAGCHSAVRESQSRDSIWEALFLNLTLGMQTLWCVTSFSRNDKWWSPLPQLYCFIIWLLSLFPTFSCAFWIIFFKPVFSIILPWSSLAVSVEGLHLVFINTVTV